jgi:hypothetical protein
MTSATEDVAAVTRTPSGVFARPKPAPASFGPAL